ncbi:hypothetical protein SteCoe_4265 [Stentor coeruleus]|uniref:Uncharacterized protein n=1 Tax=Stentor coeruleus TaxID=5963 RepID=A0A1R2CV80_9CILI|nr:hypothetical protein SteCoe_4265 [Stentor coeruleus]
MEIIEDFSNLIDSLAASLENNKEINYSSHPISNECAIGVILSKLPNYNFYLKKKIRDECQNKKKNIKKSLIKDIKTRELDSFIKKITKQGEISTVFFARLQRNYIRNCIEKTRKWVFKAVSGLAKENLQCKLFMNASNSNYQLKLQESTEEFSWKKFFHYLKVISLGYAKITEKRLTKEIKEKIEAFLKRPVKISRVVCLENLFFSEMMSEKKIGMKLSNHSKIYKGKCIGDVPSLFAEFLTLQNSSASIIEGTKKYKKDILLSRTSKNYIVITHMSNAYWRPMTLHFYYEDSGLLKNDFVTEYNLDAEFPSGSLELDSFLFSKNECEIIINSNKYLLKNASLSHLLSNTIIYYIDTPRFSSDKKATIRTLSPLQQKELLRIYTSLSSPILYPDIIPEPDLHKFSYEYLLLNNSYYSRSGSGCRNWFIQIQKDQWKNNELNFCTWDGCFCPRALQPVDFKIADMGKTRKKLKKIVGNDYCRLHQCVNLACRTAKKTSGASVLWPAIQAGIMWQQSIKPTSVFSKIITGKALDIVKGFMDPKYMTINSFKTERQLEIDKALSNPESCKKFKEQLLQEITELKRLKDHESAATDELKKISDMSSSLNNSLTTELKNCFQYMGLEKKAALGKIREKLCRLSVTEMSRNVSNRSSRPSSANRDKLKEDQGKKKEPKILASPYMQHCIPEKNPSFRLKHITNSTKVPKSRSFALLDI